MAPFEWLFRNRQTGEITIAQLPNAPLIVFLVAFGVRALLHPDGTVGTLVDVAATAGLVVWSVLEIGWGVNPFRRILGALVLVGQIVLFALR